MATQIVFGKCINKCERCGHIWIPHTDDVYSCPKCRSPYWNKPRKGLAADKVIFDDLVNKMNEQPIILDEEDQKKAALQCAIVYKFECENYKKRKPVTALCNTCFECDFWNTEKVKMLKEAFNEEIIEENKEELIKVQGDRVYSQEKTIDKSETAMQKEEENLPKTAEEILAKLENTEIIGRQDNRNLSYEEMKLKCYKCMEKYKDKDGDWQCTFFTFKTAPKYDYCRLCWELAEIWGNRAAGPKK